jgi:hypothetical protein
MVVTRTSIAPSLSKEATMTPQLTATERDNLRGNLMTLRIVVFALAMGVASFAGFSVFQRLQAPAPAAPVGPQAVAANGLQPLHIAAIAFAVVAAVMAFVVPHFLRITPQSADKPDERSGAIQAASEMVQTRTIIACALLEGAAFFNLIWYFTDGSIINLAMGGVLLLLILFHIPMSGTYYEKIEKMLGINPFAV